LLNTGLAPAIPSKWNSPAVGAFCRGFPCWRHKLRNHLGQESMHSHPLSWPNVQVKEL